MNKNKQAKITNRYYSRTSSRLNRPRLILLLLTGILLLPNEKANSEEISLKCTGKFEINRGELIKPDWETSFLTINNHGLKSRIVEKGIKKEGRTLISPSSYTITHRDNSYRIKSRYKIHRTLGTYIVDYPQRNRTLIGTCQKGRG
tara:strand:- start:1098 stop:1535 length:438 start_codon:yes stop_codon:yes gene_type:complete